MGTVSVGREGKSGRAFEDAGGGTPGDGGGQLPLVTVTVTVTVAAGLSRPVLAVMVRV